MTKGQRAKIERLVRRIGATRDEKREAAVRQIYALGIDSLEATLRVAESMQLRLSVRDHLLIVIPCLLLSFLPLGLLNSPPPRNLPLYTAISAVAIGVPIAVLLFYAIRREYYAKGLGYLLTQFNDAAALRHLLDVHLQYPDSIWVIGRSIIRLLRGVKLSDLGRIDATQRRHLCECLREFSQCEGLVRGVSAADFCLAILHAFEQIGDAKMLHSVEEVARAAVNQKVKSAAVNCLPSLTERAETTLSSSTLLRAYDGIAIPNELLRAAGPTTTESPKELLRAAESGSIREL